MNGAEARDVPARKIAQAGLASGMRAALQYTAAAGRSGHADGAEPGDRPCRA
jgi:hypothetical protein